MTDLGTHDGLPVLQTSIEIPNVGGGLRDAMKTDPRIIHAGDEVYAVFNLGSKGKIRMDPLLDREGDLEGYNRVHILAPVNATFVDSDLVRKQLEEQAERTVALRDAENGARQLDLKGRDFIDDPVGDDKAEAGRKSLVRSLVREHAEGTHTRKRKHCPLCQAPEDKAANVTQIRSRGRIPKR